MKDKELGKIFRVLCERHKHISTNALLALFENYTALNKLGCYLEDHGEMPKRSGSNKYFEIFVENGSRILPQEAIDAIGGRALVKQYYYIFSNFSFSSDIGIKYSVRIKSFNDCEDVVLKIKIDAREDVGTDSSDLVWETVLTSEEVGEGLKAKEYLWKHIKEEGRKVLEIHEKELNAYFEKALDVMKKMHLINRAHFFN